MRAVYLNTYGTIKEAFIHNDMSHRGNFQSYTASQINPNIKGIIQSNYDDTLIANRRLSLSIFRKLGVGRSTMEMKIIENAERLCTNINKVAGKEFDPSNVISCSVVNVILSILLNKQYNHDDSELLNLIKHIDDIIAIGKHNQLIDCFNILRFIPPFKGSFELFKSASQELKRYISNSIKEHKRLYAKEHVSDFVDYWIETHYNDTTETESKIDEENLNIVLQDMLMAGMETTATSLKWSIILLANNPDIQSKIHKEINQVVGKEQVICLKDRERLPYLEAFTWEMQRFKTLVLFSPHFTRVDTKLGGYDIPANTFIYPNTMGIHLDSDIFDQPTAFRPERFLDSEGKFVKNENVLPFGIGKRSCLGELLARKELFLFTAFLVQRFNFYLPEGIDEINENGNENVVYSPKRFNICAIPKQ